MRNADYFAYGADGAVSESYCDKHHYTKLGIYRTTVRDNHHDYLKPQENGSHFGTRFVTVNDENQTALSVKFDAPFSFSFSPYSQETLASIKHNYELIEDDFNVLCIDHFMSIGSYSCGPTLDEKYRLNESEFSGLWVMQTSRTKS